MANTVIQLKHSTLTGNVPSSLANGEISINSRDGKFFYSTPAGVVVTHYPYPGPAGLNQEIQFNDSGVLGSNSGLTFNKSTGYFKAPIIESTNNGNGTNFKVGDDTWIGDVNAADTLRIAGQQNVNNAYIIFGASNANTLGRAGTGPLTYTGAFTATGILSGSEISATQSSGDEGGQINLALAATNTSLSGSVAIDIFQNRLRIFETSGTNRGVYIDMANGASVGVGTNLLSPSSSTDGFARTQANAAFIQANAAFLQANTPSNVANSAASYANSAFLVANTPTHVANSAASYANSAFAKANNEGGVNTTQNTNITNAGTYANAAFTRANNSLNSNTGGTVTANTTFSGNVFLTGNGTTLSVTSNLSFISPNTQNTITARMINGGTLSFSSNSGELFSITDSLATGSIFSVNDISGLPVIDVDANGWISFAQFGGNVHIYNAATSVSNSTGALVVDGGVGVKGNVYADAIYDGGIEIIAYANTAFLAANTPSHVANSAASYANSAFIKANAAFNQANTGGGGTTDFGFGIIYTANNNTFANAAAANSQVNFVGENGTVVYANATTKTITFAGTPGAQGLTVDYGFVNDPIYYSIDYGSLA